MVWVRYEALNKVSSPQAITVAKRRNLPDSIEVEGVCVAERRYFQAAEGYLLEKKLP